MPVEAYEAVIELTRQLAELTPERDALVQMCRVRDDKLAAEVQRCELAGKAEAAACKRADASEGAANKEAKAAIKEARQECAKAVAEAREQLGIAEAEKAHLGREPAALRSGMHKLKATHAKLAAVQAVEHARELTGVQRDLDDVERNLADARAELLVVKGKVSAATTAAAASTLDALQATWRLARALGRAALAERKFGRAEVERSLAVERAKKLVLQLDALGRMRGADVKAELKRLGREVSTLGAQLEKATAIGWKRAREATEAYRRERLALRTADSAQRKRLAAEK
ncbi:hypothetical protein T492DRAFT_951692, partial [Pavlovales sp. CCMP2436]